MWLSNQTCKQLVINAWNKPQIGSITFQLIGKLNETKKSLIDQDKQYFGKIQSQIIELEKQLIELQDMPQGTSQHQVKETKQKLK